MGKLTDCFFCGDTARYRTEEGTPFCYWHTLLYCLGYQYVLA